MLTDVTAVMTAYGTPQEAPVSRATPSELRRHDFPAGSMGPKVEAVCRFVELTGGAAAIGSLRDAVALLRGEAGTVITASGDYAGPHTSGPLVPAPGIRPFVPTSQDERPYGTAAGSAHARSTTRTSPRSTP